MSPKRNTRNSRRMPARPKPPQGPPTSPDAALSQEEPSDLNHNYLRDLSTLAKAKRIWYSISVEDKSPKPRAPAGRSAGGRLLACFVCGCIRTHDDVDISIRVEDDRIVKYRISLLLYTLETDAPRKLGEFKYSSRTYHTALRRATRKAIKEWDYWRTKHNLSGIETTPFVGGLEKSQGGNSRKNPYQTL